MSHVKNKYISDGKRGHVDDMTDIQFNFLLRFCRIYIYSLYKYKKNIIKDGK